MTAAEEWLAQADPDPDHARLWLRQATILVLPVGHKWAVVRAPADVGSAAVMLGATGPVMAVETEQRYYFLVAPETVETWEPLPDVACLGSDTWLEVPHPKVRTPPGPHWVIPPDGSGRLVDPDVLRANLISAGESSARVQP
ncbi:hypothetical protein AB0K71_05645 [Streptomyces syringium]|uniref:hypothetical protein n=1 Tax=Streptomyces syringium TaxID=76729 RepID=UPI00343FB63C